MIRPIEAETPTLIRHPETTLPRWTPLEEFTKLRRHMDDLFNRFFSYTPPSRLIPGEMVKFEPPVDIYETPENVILFVALPGYVPEEVTVEAMTNRVTITGERKPLYDVEKAIPYRQTGLFGASVFSINYTLPTEIVPNKIRAVFCNGILHLEMPKTEQAKIKSVKVNVKPA